MPPRKEPQDRLVKVEAKQADIVFEFNGDTYTITADRADNIELFEMAEDGKNLAAVRGFLGQEQWDHFKDSIRTPDGRVPSAPTEEFLNLLSAKIGGGTPDAPNSAASPTS